jgi:hypothetical protein
MRLRILFTILITFAFLQSCGQSFPVKTEISPFNVSDKYINILRHQYGDPTLHFLSLHDNEDTGVKAAFEFMRVNGGSLIELQYGKVRNIVFCGDTTELQIDPNRIFSAPGIEAFFQHEKSAQRISSFADTLLRLYDFQKTGYILTLHNNTDSAFSIRSYLAGNYLEGVASEVYINHAMDPDDFILVTEPFFFEYLKNLNINAVLQSTTATDDGSLSLYAGLRKIPYINVEVQHRHLEENLRLIYAVNGMLQEYRKKDLNAGQAVSNN